MSRDILEWYRKCTDFANSREPSNRPHGKLVKVATRAPLDIVALDILSGLSVSPEKHKYLLVATDYFSKWIEDYPLEIRRLPRA